MTVIRPNSISGITSITAQSGSLEFYDSTGSTLTVTGNLTGNVTGDINAGIITATSITGVTTAGITTAYIGSLNDGPISGTRNRIINGDMRIDQRNAGASVTPTDGQYTLDRWRTGASAASKFSLQRSTTAPAGFTNSMLLTSLSAHSLSATDNFEMFQYIEGFNVADLAWGTSAAQSITISFWVRSSLAGAFGGAINNSAFNRSYPFSYTINSANTWEQKSITVAGDTSGTWLTDNGIGLILCVCIGAGSTRSGTAGSWSSSWLASTTGATSIVSTNGATFYITGVQLEPGTVATPFERRSYGQELSLCQRYYQRLSGTSTTLFGYWDGTNQAVIWYGFPVNFRSAPTGLAVSNVSHFLINNSQVANPTPNSIAFSKATEACLEINVTVASSGSSTGKACRLFGNNASAYIEFTGTEL